MELQLFTVSWLDEGRECSVEIEAHSEAEALRLVRFYLPETETHLQVSRAKQRRAKAALVRA